MRAMTKSGVNRLYRDAHEVIRDGGVPVEIGEHVLCVAHGFFDAHGNVEEMHVACGHGERARSFLHNVAARIADGVDRMTEADDDFAMFNTAAHVSFGLVRRCIAKENFKGNFVGAAVLGAFDGRR